MTKEKKESALAIAAAGFADELKRFEDVAGTLSRSSFGSQKALERGADLLKQAASAEEALSERGRELAQALGEARRMQEAQAQSIREKANELAERTEVFRGLMERFAQLGQQASKLNETVKSFGDAGKLTQEADVSGDLDKLAHDAEQLARDADGASYGEISRQADSLRQQVLSVKNRLKLLFEKLPVS